MEVKETCFTLPINPNNFPSKLWRLVNDPRICSIGWDSSGEGIVLYQEPFEDEVLGSNEEVTEYFKTTSITSFFRQLNLYGFRKVHLDHDISEKQRSQAFVWAQMHHFHNPNFKRANPELLVNLKRLTPVNKAKIAAGIKVTSRSTRRFSYPMPNVSKENSAVIKKESVLDERTPPSHHGNGLQKVKDSDQTPNAPQVFATGHDDPDSGFPHFPMESSHPSISMHSHEDSPSSVSAEKFIPHHSQYTFYAPVYHYCNPGSLDSNMQCSQQPADSNAYCGYYPDYYFGYVPYTGQNPNWQADGSPDPRESDLNLNGAVSVENEMQAEASSNLLTK